MQDNAPPFRGVVVAVGGEVMVMTVVGDGDGGERDRACEGGWGVGSSCTIAW